MTDDEGLRAGIHKVNEGLDENRGFVSDNVSSQEVFRFFVDDEFYETVVGIPFLKAESIAFGCRRVAVDGNIHVVSRFFCICFRKAYLSRFRIGVGYCRDKIVSGPTPIFRFAIFKEIVGNDFRFVVGFVAEGS